MKLSASILLIVVLLFSFIKETLALSRVSILSPLKKCDVSTVHIKEYGAVKTYLLSVNSEIKNGYLNRVSLEQKGNKECHTEMIFSPSPYKNNNIKSIKVNSQCSNENIEILAKKLQLMFEHCKVNFSLKELIHLRVTTTDGRINFPDILKTLNTSPIWSSDLLKYLREHKKPYSAGYTAKILKQATDNTGIFKPLRSVMKKMKCQLYQPSDVYTEILSEQQDDPKSNPIGYSKSDLIKLGLFSNTEAKKEFYPEIPWVDFRISCK